MTRGEMALMVFVPSYILFIVGACANHWIALMGFLGMLITGVAGLSHSNKEK